MKIKMLITISLLIAVVLVITGGCATTPRTQEGREAVDQEVFFETVKSGDYAEVKRLIDAGADVNTQEKEGWTALMLASEYGRTEVARLLIDAGAYVNAQTNEGFTALIYASEKGFPEVARLLVEVEADVNVQNDDGSTALMYALAYEHTEVVMLLIQKGADVNIQNNYGNTALLLAVGMEFTETAGLLIEAGADIHIESNDGGTALGYAVGLENNRLIQLINEAALQLQKNAELFEESIYTEITKDVSFLPGSHPGVLPEGRSVYFGEYTCAQGLAGSITVMHRSGGDLTLVKLNGSPLSERNPQPVGHFRAVGTYNPLSNRYTIVPDAWISPPTLGWIMAGSTGV